MTARDYGPHSLICEELHEEEWVERSRMPISTPIRRVEDPERLLETLAVTTRLWVIAAGLDEMAWRLRLLNGVDRTLAVIRGDGSVSVEGGEYRR